MENNIDLDKLPDEYLIRHYQDLMFSLAKSSKDIQNIFLTAYYNVKNGAQNKLITKASLFTLLGYSVIKMFGGLDNSNDIYVYLLGLNIALYNFIAEKYEYAKLKLNAFTLEKFILNNIADDYLEVAAYNPDDTKMARLLDCLTRACFNIILSEEYMIRIQNYKYMSKLKITTNCPNLNKKTVNDGLILLSRSILEIDSNKTELELKGLASKGDISSIIFYYLSKPKYSTKLINDLIMNYPSEEFIKYPIFLAIHLSGLYPEEFCKILKQKLEKENKRSIFTEDNGRYSDFGAFCECVYFSTCNDNLTKQDIIKLKKAERYLKNSKTDLAFFYKSYLKAIYAKGKKQQNGKAALTNFAARGLSNEIIEPENISLKNIYEK